MLYFLIAVPLAYLLGSIPTAYIFAKVLKGIDIREHGSGNVGATNVGRVIGRGPGIAVFALDFLKGFVSVTLVPVIVQNITGFSPEHQLLGSILPGSAAISGHIWTIFLRFKGGKGVATTAGVMAGLSPGIFVTCLMVWCGVFFISRYVSLASISAALALPILATLTNKDIYFILFACVFCLLGVFSHRSNIRRLMQGTENKM